MKTNFNTIISTLYSFPGEFYIDVRESGRGYTDFYLYNDGYSYATRIYRVKTKELPEDLDRFATQLFLDNFLEYIRMIDDDHYYELRHFEKYVIHTSVESFKKYIKDKIKRGEYFSHSERVAAVYKPNTAWTFEVADDFRNPGDIDIYLTHKDRIDMKVHVDTLPSKMLDGRDFDFVRHIDINKDYFIKEYKEDIDDLFNKGE